MALARWLAETDYGTFAIAYSSLLLIGTAHTALVTEPLLVFAQGRYAESRVEYLRFSRRAHWGVTLLGTAIGIIAWLAFSVSGLDTLAVVALLVGGAAPLYFLSWLARRAAIAFLRPELAAAGSFVYLVILVGGLFGMRALDRLSIGSAFVLMSAAGVISGVLILLLLRDRSAHRTGEVPLEADVAGQQWRYGRWALLGSLLSWVPGNVYFFVLPLASGLAGTAALRALITLTTPVMHAVNALGSLTIPVLAERARELGTYRPTSRTLAAWILLPAAYGVILGLFGPAVLEMLYGGNYVEFADVLWILALLPPLSGLIAILGAELRARERPDLTTYASLASAAAAASIGVGLTLVAGLAGAALGWCISYAVCATTLAILRRVPEDSA